MQNLKQRILTIILGLAVFLISFSVYFYTLSPTITAGDSTEMVNAALVLGIPHQPSYPFQVILGHLFSRLPLPLNPILKVNLMAAFFEAGTAFLIYLIILRLFSLAINQKKEEEEEILAAKGKISSFKKIPEKLLSFYHYFLAVTASLFLSFSTTFWQYGTRAEVFSLNNFLISLVILLTLIALNKKSKLLIYFAILIYGLTLTHHQTAILISMPLLYIVLLKQKVLSLKSDFFFKGALIGLIGFLPYYFLLTNLASKNPALNWGNPVNLQGVIRAISRADYGTVGAYLTTPWMEKNPYTPLDQLSYYFQSLTLDFTLAGLVLAVIGAFYLLKSKRRLFNFIMIGFLSGAFFLAYANFPLGDSFHLATTKRFQLLPDLFFTFLVAFGVYYLWQKLEDLKLNTADKKSFLTKIIVFLTLSLSFLSPLISNFTKANARHNLITEKYAKDMYLPTEENAIILLSGDVANFSANFIKTVVLKGDNRIVFTPGQFHLPWFTEQLKKRYPDLIIPKAEAGKMWTTTTQLIQANLDHRPIYISPELVVYDPEVEKEYVLYPKNLLFKPQKKGSSEKVEKYREETQRLWESLDLAEFNHIRKQNPVMEDSIIGYYIRFFHNVGYMFESVELYDDATREYKRALEIDPTFADGYKALGVVYGLKLKPNDPNKAIDNLQKFIGLAGKNRQEEIDSARYTIYKIIEDENLEQKELMEEQTKEATRSGQKEATGSGVATKSGEVKKK